MRRCGGFACAAGSAAERPPSAASRRGLRLRRGLRRRALRRGLGCFAPRGLGGLRASRFGRGRGVRVAPAAASPGGGRSRTRSGETSRRGVVTPPWSPRQVKAAVQAPSVSAAQGLWSRTAIRRRRRPSTRRCRVGRMKRRPRTPNQRPETSSRSSEVHMKRSTSKARSASGSAGVSIRAIGDCVPIKAGTRAASLLADEAADRGGSQRPARLPQPAAAGDRGAFQRPGEPGGAGRDPVPGLHAHPFGGARGAAGNRRTAANRGWQPARRGDRGPDRAAAADAGRAERRSRSRRRRWRRSRSAKSRRCG